MAATEATQLRILRMLRVLTRLIAHLLGKRASPVSEEGDVDMG